MPAKSHTKSMAEKASQWASLKTEENMTGQELERTWDNPGPDNLVSTAGFQVDPHLVSVVNHEFPPTSPARLESFMTVIGFFGGTVNLDAMQIPLELVSTIKPLGMNPSPEPLNLAKFKADYATALKDDTVDDFMRKTFTNMSERDLQNYHKELDNYLANQDPGK